MNRLLLLLLLLTQVVLANETSVRQFMAREMPNYSVVSVRVQGNWALCHWAYGSEAEGMALLKKLGSSWEIATSGGGAMGPGELAQYGVPEAQWGRLLGHQLNGEELQGGRAVLSKPAWTWMTSKRRLTRDDLQSCSAWELALMRNEIFAVHGRTFSDPDLRAYFQSRGWYRPNRNFNQNSLSALEKANANFIMSYQRSTGKM